jgi:SAM-dependent methyltransferase
MADDATPGGPSDRAFVWSGATGSAWLANADRLESQLRPINGPLFAAAALRAGETVIDVGCGRGVTSRIAARHVGPLGRVVGVDIAPDLVSAARAAAVDEGLTNLEWVTADAQRYAFPPDAADVVLSRFGVRFFDDATAAFANLRGAVRHGGRLVMAVWLPRDLSPLHGRVLEVAVDTAARLGVVLELDPVDGGLSMFGIDEWVRPILVAAGWSQISFRPVRTSVYAAGEGTSPREAVETRMAVGPLAALLTDVDATTREQVAAAIEADLATRWDGRGVRIDAGFAIITAQR